MTTTVISRGELHDLARTLRRHALDVDRDPGRYPAFLEEEELRLRGRRAVAGTPETRRLDVDGEVVPLDSCLANVVVAEELAWGDAPMAIGRKGPAMAGFVVGAIGSDEQRERFFGHLAGREAWTYFALTEPDRGSDPASMTTQVVGGSGGEGRIRGTKKYIGNAARADLGVVFARHSRGPIGVGAYLVETARPGFEARPLETLGFRALQLSEISLDVEVTRADLLGSHLPPSRRGMGAATHVFYTLRPQLAASALGIARAAHDYVVEHRRDLDAVERAAMARYGTRIAATRAVIRTAARQIDAGRLAGGPGSASKAMSVALADELLSAASRFLGPGSRWEHPFLDKWIRDLRGLELMEGTSTVQKLTLAQAYVQRRGAAGQG